MKKRTTALLSLLLAALFALAVFPACIERPTDDPTPAPSEAVGSPSGEDVTPAADVTNSPSGEVMNSPSGEDGTGSPPGEDPTLGPEDERLIDEAWKVASRIGEVHGLKLKKELATVIHGSSSPGCSIYFYDESGDNGIQVPFRCMENNNELRMIFDEIQPATSERYWNEMLEKYFSEETNERLAAFYDKQIIVTPAEIAAAGVTATSGEEYFAALGRCFAEKIAKEYENTPSDLPWKCKEARVREVVPNPNREGSFYISIAVRPENLYAYAHYTDYLLTFDDGSTDQEFYGWTGKGGGVELEKRSDGSWVGKVRFGDSEWRFE